MSAVLDFIFSWPGWTVNVLMNGLSCFLHARSYADKPSDLALSFFFCNFFSVCICANNLMLLATGHNLIRLAIAYVTPL